jgi:hypothetical protein
MESTMQPIPLQGVKKNKNAHMTRFLLRLAFIIFISLLQALSQVEGETDIYLSSNG